MNSMLRCAVIVCALVSSLTAAAQQRGLVIAGGVYEDRMALAVRPHFIGHEGVTVKLYRGDRTPLATTKTNRDGLYVFNVDAPGDYVVTVDSRTFHADAWPEQTFGPAGSRCAHPLRGTITTLYEGPCFGGSTATGSDEPSALATSEHLAQVTVAQDSPTGIDFAFSFDAVITTADGGRTQQGTLRQYLINANARPGPNRMRFVPVERAPEQRETVMGLAPRWWTIRLASPLPELRDDDTTVDGTAYSFMSPATLADVHPGRFGESVTLENSERQVSRLRRPELELVGSGPSGIVCAGSCGLRGLAIHGAATGIITRADARLEHVLVGSSPDGAPAAGGVVGVQAERGTVVARHLLVTTQTRIGISVAPEAKLDGEHLDVSRSGAPLTGAGVVLLSNGSAIRASFVTTNPGAGIILGSTDGSAPATGNTIDGSTISGNQAGVVIGPNSSRNVITRNDIMWNRIGGVTITPHEPNARPRENRISANRFDENGLRPIILNLDTEDPNALSARGAGNCTSATGLSTPHITSVRVVEEGGARAVVRGRACPGQVIEIYQSYVTAGVRETSAEMPRVRDREIERETISTQDRTLALPSIGEFNYLGATNTNAVGDFEATFPLPVVTQTRESDNPDEETNIWATQVLTAASPNDRAFSALAIDTAGNTSEMSVRRKAD